MNDLKTELELFNKRERALLNLRDLRQYLITLDSIEVGFPSNDMLPVCYVELERLSKEIYMGAKETKNSGFELDLLIRTQKLCDWYFSVGRYMHIKR